MYNVNRGTIKPSCFFRVEEQKKAYLNWTIIHYQLVTLLVLTTKEKSFSLKERKKKPKRKGKIPCSHQRHINNIMDIPLFIYPIVPFKASSVARFRPATLSVSHRVRMTANNGAGGHKAQPPNPGNSDDENTAFGRFSEFTPSSGDAHVQDDLVREVIWQVVRLSTSENLESTIETHVNAASDLLADMYTRSERNIIERNDELALRASLPNISKWNQQLMAGSKTSKLQKLQISKELELVHAMLKRTSRKQSSGRRRHNRSRTTTRRISDSTLVTTTPTPLSLNSISSPSAIFFTTFVCTVALKSFEAIASQEGGPARLANYAAVSSFFILSLAYLQTLHRIVQRAQEKLQRQSGSLYKNNRRNRF